jgi:hypothetical protein
MKFQILNNEELGFFDNNGNKTATIKISGSNNLVLNPSGSGDIILGDDDTVNDIEIGISSTPSNMTFLGGGTITSNGATLNIGDPTNNDIIVLNSPTLISGSVSLDSSITASYISVSNDIFASTYYGDGSNLTGISSDPFPYTGSAVISGSLEVIGDTNFTGSINFLNNSSNKIVFENAASITQPQIRLRTHNTGITMRGNDVLALLSNGAGMIGMKKTAATSINFPSAAKVGFTTNTSVEAYNPETYFRRYSSGVIGIGYGAVTSANLSGSLILTNITASGHVSASTYYGDGSNLTGISSDPFPYNGDAVITGSNSLTGNYALKVANSSGTDILAVENDGKVVIDSSANSSTPLIIGNPPNPRYNIEIASGSRNTMRFASNTNNGGFHKIGFAGHTSTTNMGAAIIGQATGASGRVDLYFSAGSGDSNEADVSNDKVMKISHNEVEIYQRVEAKNDSFTIGSSNLGDSILYLGQESKTGIARDYLGAGNAADFVIMTGGPSNTAISPSTHTRLRVTKNGNTEISGSLTANQGVNVIGDVSASTYYGDGSNLTGISSDLFPYTGSAVISGSLEVIGNVTGSLTVESSGSTVFEVIGSEGQLFSITDSLSGSLFAVSDVSGLPILEVFSDDTVKIGSFNNEAIEVNGSDVNFNNLPTSDPGVAGRLYQTGSDAIGASAGFQVVCISQG